MLVAHDGPEYAEHSSLLSLLSELPPLRATLIGPVDRNEMYSASARYSRALAEEILPALPSAPVRIGLGASLGALALFHAHRRYPDTFDALFLQSGSFFRRAESYERNFPRYERIVRFVGGIHRNRPSARSRSCSAAARSRRTSRRTGRSRRRSASAATTFALHEFRDGHNWVAWRDSFQPHLGQLLRE